MLKIFDEFNVPGVLAINGSAIATAATISAIWSAKWNKFFAMH